MFFGWNFTTIKINQLSTKLKSIIEILPFNSKMLKIKNCQTRTKNGRLQQKNNHKNQKITLPKDHNILIFIKIFLLLSNIFLINCSIAEKKESDTIEDLYAQMSNLENASCQQFDHEIKKLKNTKIFAFEKNVGFSNTALELFRSISTDTYKDKVYITFVSIKGDLKHYINKECILSAIINLRDSIVDKRCHDFDLQKTLNIDDKGRMKTVGPLCLNINNISLFFEKIKKYTSLSCDLTKYFILLADSTFSDIEILVIYRHIAWFNKNIIWIAKDEIFIDPLTTINYNVEFKKTDLNFFLYDFKTCRSYITKKGTRKFCIKKYYMFINENFSYQVYFSLNCFYYKIFEFIHENDSIELYNGFINLSLSKQQSSDFKINVENPRKNSFDVFLLSVSLFYRISLCEIYIIVERETNKIVYTSRIGFYSSKKQVLFEFSFDVKSFLNLVSNLILPFSEISFPFEASKFLMLAKGYCDFQDDPGKHQINISNFQDKRSLYLRKLVLLNEKMRKLIEDNNKDFDFSIYNIIDNENSIIKNLISEEEGTNLVSFCTNQNEIEIYNKIKEVGDSFAYYFDTILRQQKIRLVDVTRSQSYQASFPKYEFAFKVWNKKTKKNMIFFISVAYLDEFHRIVFNVYEKEKIEHCELLLIKTRLMDMIKSI